MPDGIFVNTSSTAPVYHYYTVDIVTNKILAQIPFEDVAYERKIKEPGSFEGVITISDQTENLDLYNSTMPGKVALYVTRNGECVWGGIIWGRTYDLGGRNLSISASEFSSYLQKRHIWKTYSYKFEAEILKTTAGGTSKVTLKTAKLKIPLKTTDDSGNPTKVYVTFSESNLAKYTGYYAVSSAETPTQTVFYLNIGKLPANSAAYQNVTVSVKVDTYDYIKEMLNDVLIDFSDTSFASETIAPGVKVPLKISSRYVTDNIVTINLSDVHDLIAGQKIEIYNLEKTLCGKQTISEVPTNRQIKYKIPVLTITHVSRASDTATVYVDATDMSGLKSVPFVAGQSVIVTSSSSTFNNSGSPVTILDVTENSISYENAGSNLSKTPATGKITVQNLTVVSTNPINYRVYAREITTTGPKRVKSVKRYGGYVYVYTTSPHGFNKADKVLVKFSADGTDYTSLNNDGVPVSVLSVTPTMFKYATANLVSIRTTTGGAITMPNPSKHTVTLATPVKRMKLSTAGLHDYTSGDLVSVKGVDRIDWTQNVYNGFQKVIDVDTSEDATSPDVLTVTDYMVQNGRTVTLWLNRSHGLNVGDSIKVYNYSSPLTYLNNTFKLTDRYDLDSASSGVAWVRFILPSTVTSVGKTANTSGRVAPYGASWFTYDMPEYGATREPDDTVSVVFASYKKYNRTVTLTTTGISNCAVGDRIYVDVGSALYNGYHTIKSVSDVDEISYSLPSDKTGLPTADIAKQAVKGSFKRYRTKVGYIPTLAVSINRIGRDNNQATIWSVDHDFSAGDKITVEMAGTGYDDFENGGEPITITSVTDNTFTYASTGSDVGVYSITAYSVVNKVATLTTSVMHSFAAGQYVTISNINGIFNGTWLITGTPLANKFTFNIDTINRSSSSGFTGRAASTINVTDNTHYAYIDYSSIERTIPVTNLLSVAGQVTMTAVDHGFAVGDYVLTYVKGKTYKNFRNNNQPVQIVDVTTDTFTYYSLPGYDTGTVASVAVDGYVVYAPQVEKTPVVIARTYGEFPNNSDMGGLSFSTNDYSATQYPNDLIRGSDLISVYEHLERYTSNKNGFDYRIDCSLVSKEDDKKTFKRTFVLIPRTPETLVKYLNSMPDGKLSIGTYAPPSAFGADKLVFEYPGNIQNVSFAENAGNSATRVFVVGNNSDLGGTASARYSAAADNDLLGAGWPLLDKVEKVEWPLKGINVVNTDNWGNYDSEADMQLTAERFLRETKPPSGDFIITVNGSLTPEIGSFNPGDWCSIVIRDAFVAQRMASNLEPRKDVIVRKIDGIRVSVPNSPAFPEIIDLTLVTEWQVDAVGK